MKLLHASFQFLAAFLICILMQCSSNSVDLDSDATDTQEEGWIAPDTSSVPKNEAGNLIRYGRALISRTAEYFGPHGKVNHTANVMNCQNCHLNTGTKLFANSFSAVASMYPKFRGRSGTVETIEKRINDCMERSMNGKHLDSLSREMRAMVAYINWVGKDVPKGVTPKGASVVELPYMEREADQGRGKFIFEINCIVCHGSDGQGKPDADSLIYLYPPLWGPKSYTQGAGMYRLSRLAGFIKSNMPNLKSSYENPTLTDEQAWDVGAFIISMPRPDKKFNDDWPDISKKPVDYSFGPFADSFSETRHKYGPFIEIIEASKKK